MTLTPIPELVAELKAGRMVILVDDEDRENEGDLVIAAEHVTPEAINFMATHGRGLICMPITEDHARQLNLPLMVQENRAPHGTAFTVSIEAARGVTTGISAFDRAHTIRVATAPGARPEDVVTPGHVFPLVARPGGVLVRAGHTEACCDLAQMAGCSAAAVLCEIMKDDGTMARLPDLVQFAERHRLKTGSIADLIRFRSQNETLVKRVAERVIETLSGPFRLVVYIERISGATHLALVRGEIDPQSDTLVRVHEPTSLLDLLVAGPGTHSWGVQDALAAIAAAGHGVMVLLNCSESPGRLIERAASGTSPKPAPRAELLTYGIGAQILRDLNVGRMRLMANPRKMPSVAGWELEVTGYVQHAHRSEGSA
ncbi:MAG: 3,4-dihydroxy-2-butanone-4-phosphate synthase [Burkholderiales bacterium]|nr:3,4-dihydroxy-2-butanone-4-phosphate synthase [Burkholderiales bacterium]